MSKRKRTPRTPPKQQSQPQQTAVTAAPTDASIDATARLAMIAERAYYKAEQRGFTPGDEVQDRPSARSTPPCTAS